MCHLVVRVVSARIETTEFSDMFLQESEEWGGLEDEGDRDLSLALSGN